MHAIIKAQLNCKIREYNEINKTTFNYKFPT